MKTVIKTFGDREQHWVGDGFPVRSLFSYHDSGAEISPFLLLDYAGPYDFVPAQRPRGVGTHPHRGFETVTIVYDGEVEHRDSTGAGGVIGPGDVQWMTAGSGILHQEFHSDAFTRRGGLFRTVQLWVNLPAHDKAVNGGYQSLLSAQIPSLDLPHGAGTLRIIAGEYGGVRGPARTYTTLNVWDAKLTAGANMALELPEGQVAILVVLTGRITVNGKTSASEAEAILLSPEGHDAKIAVDRETTLLVLTGQPIDEPLVAYGPFVMNTQDEIRRANEDYQNGLFGSLAA